MVYQSDIVMLVHAVHMCDVDYNIRIALADSVFDF